MDTVDYVPDYSFRDTFRNAYERLYDRVSHHINRTRWDIPRWFRGVKPDSWLTHYIPRVIGEYLILAPDTPRDTELNGLDLILYLDVHGETCMRDSHPVIKQLDYDFTIMEAAPCGVSNYYDGLSCIMEPNTVEQVLRNKQHYTRDELIAYIQFILRASKKTFARNMRAEIDHGYAKDYKSVNTPEGIENFERYEKEIGWNIITHEENGIRGYMERDYQMSDECVLIKVLYAKQGSPFTKGDNVVKHREHIKRTDLLKLCRDSGHEHVLLLDASCANNTLTLTREQSDEVIKKYRQLGLAGGSKKKSKTRKNVKN